MKKKNWIKKVNLVKARSKVPFSTRLDRDVRKFYKKRHDLLNEVLRAYMEAQQE